MKLFCIVYIIGRIYFGLKRVNLESAESVVMVCSSTTSLFFLFFLNNSIRVRPMHQAISRPDTKQDA